MSPGPAVTPMASTSESATSASESAADTTSSITDRCARAASSGTTPAPDPVHVLREDHVAQELVVAPKDGRRGLVAGRLEPEDKRRPRDRSRVTGPPGAPRPDRSHRQEGGEPLHQEAHLEALPVRIQRRREAPDQREGPGVHRLHQRGGPRHGHPQPIGEALHPRYASGRGGTGCTSTWRSTLGLHLEVHVEGNGLHLHTRDPRRVHQHRYRPLWVIPPSATGPSGMESRPAVASAAPRPGSRSNGGAGAAASARSSGSSPVRRGPRAG
jgi:hypothetical protein